MHLVKQIPYQRPDGIRLPWVMTIAEVLAPSVGDIRTPDPRRLDVRYASQPDINWLYNTLNPPVSFDLTTFPGIDQSDSSFKSPAAKSLKDCHLLEPSFTWFYPITDGFTQKWVPTWYEEIGYRSRDSLRIDVRNIPEPAFTWDNSVTDAEISKWIGIFDEELSSRRSNDPGRIRVQQINEPDFNWIYRPLNFDSQWWPGVEELLHSFRSPPGGVLDVRNVPEPAFSWPFGVVDADIAQKLPPTWEESSSFRSSKARDLDLRDIHPPTFGWIYNYIPVIFDSALWPAFEELLRSFRSGDSKKVDSNINEPSGAWIFQPVDSFNASLLPVWLEELTSFLSKAAKPFDLSQAPQPAFSWDNSVVDADIAVKLAWNYLRGLRTPDFPKLNLFYQADLGWIYMNLPVVSPFDETLWPAIEELLRSYRAADRSKIFTGSINEPDITTQLIPLVEVLAPSIGDKRTPSPLKLDLLRMVQSEPAWIYKNLPVPSVYDETTMWPVIEELLRSFRSGDRAKLNVRRINEPDFTAWYLQAAEMFAVYNGGDRTPDPLKLNVKTINKPDTSWVYRLLNPVFDPALWPAMEEPLRAYRSRDQAKLDVRSINEPPFSWVFGVNDGVISSYWPAIEELLRSLRSGDPKKLRLDSVNEPDISWLGKYLQPLFDPQYWPAIEELMRAYRSNDRSRLDLGSIAEPQFGWVQQVIDAILAQNWPAIEELLRSDRSKNGNILNVKAINQPSDGWIFVNLPPVIASLLRPMRTKNWHRTR